MTNKEKSDLQWKVRHCLGEGLTCVQTIEKLSAYGFKKATIRKYYNAFKTN